MGLSREQEIERECLIWLNKEVGFFWKNASVGIYDQAAGSYRKGNVFQINGVSDIIGLDQCGNVYFIEVKTNTGVQSLVQLAFEKQIKKHKGNYLLVRSLEELKREFGGE